ncbi:phage baseplate assembly protein V [Nguyenibacter vanlangensis]|uniref:Phage baseplate assembly protein V n=1 Tax=Nguyenibacter vanlangensis TaxID=1216886 RepID=A0ABZ3D1R3_9PROT
MNARALGDHDRQIANMVRIGVIAAVQGNMATVTIGDVTTDWLYWISRRAYVDYDWWAPVPGEQVVVLALWGDVSQGVILGAIPQDAQVAPGTGAQWSKRFADGATLTYDPGTHILTANIPDGGIVVNAGKSVTVNAPAILASQNIDAGGNLSAGTGATGSFTTPTGAIVTVQDGIITNIM